jgi:hypothetical protein
VAFVSRATGIRNLHSDRLFARPRLFRSIQGNTEGSPKWSWVRSGTSFQCDALRESGDFILGGDPVLETESQQNLHIISQ